MDEIENIVNEAVIDYVEKKISFEDFRFILDKFDVVEVYDQLGRDGKNDLWAIIDMTTDSFEIENDQSGNFEKSILTYYKKIAGK